jgi:hypothetical protein
MALGKVALNMSTNWFPYEYCKSLQFFSFLSVIYLLLYPTVPLFEETAGVP